MAENNNRPVIKIPLSFLEKTLEWISSGVILYVFYMTLNSWADLPNRIPTHYGFSGQADAWGSKGTLLALPVVMVVFYVLLGVLSRFPHVFNYPVPITVENAGTQYQNARTMLSWLKVEVLGIFAYLEWCIIETALRKTQDLGWLFLPVSLIAVFGTMGYYMIRMFKNR